MSEPVRCRSDVTPPAPRIIQDRVRERGCKSRAAFTLAEVLITLGIIGIVAAMTIPNLVSNYRNKVYATQLKAVYSKLLVAQRTLNDEYGTPESWTFTGWYFGDVKEKSANDEILERYRQLLGGGKVCEGQNNADHKPCGIRITIRSDN